MFTGNKRFTRLIILLTVFTVVVISSCQKDPAVTDSTNTGSVVLSPDSYLATSGTLSVMINDSTYTFDATKDSIAFINVHENDTSRFFGITAINKEHTLSFGISGSGFVASSTTTTVAGSQLLLNVGETKPLQQFSLSKLAGQKDFGTISIDKYRQGNELAKGNFVTFLATDEKINSPFYRVTGSFDLQFK